MIYLGLADEGAWDEGHPTSTYLRLAMFGSALLATGIVIWIFWSSSGGSWLVCFTVAYVSYLVFSKRSRDRKAAHS
jgi:hypothetical protein